MKPLPFKIPKGTDIYRNYDCQYKAQLVNDPMSDKHPNIIISDASMGRLQHDDTLEVTGSTIFQSVVDLNDEKSIEDIFNILNIL